MDTDNPVPTVLGHDINDVWDESDNPVQMIDELDTQFTDEIVCPHCGHVFSESYEYIGDDIVECPECERKFELVSEEYVVYTTSKVDWLKQWRTYNNNQIFRADWKIWREKNTVKVRFNE